MPKKGMGRPSVFDNKTANINGLVTDIGRQAFEARRKELSQLYERVMGRPIHASDGDVTEFLARGAKPTEAYLREKRKKEA